LGSGDGGTPRAGSCARRRRARRAHTPAPAPGPASRNHRGGASRPHPSSPSAVAGVRGRRRSTARTAYPRASTRCTWAMPRSLLGSCRAAIGGRRREGRGGGAGGVPAWPVAGKGRGGASEVHGGKMSLTTGSAWTEKDRRRPAACGRTEGGG
ncbi:hypothetical protein BAE44_0012195, partial [Dichanthelium oligosanthes]